MKQLFLNRENDRFTGAGEPAFGYRNRLPINQIGICGVRNLYINCSGFP